MGETTVISTLTTTLNFSNNNHIIISAPPKKPPRKSSSEYVSDDADVDFTATSLYGEPISEISYEDLSCTVEFTEENNDAFVKTSDVQEDNDSATEDLSSSSSEDGDHQEQSHGDSVMLTKDSVMLTKNDNPASPATDTLNQETTQKDSFTSEDRPTTPTADPVNQEDPIQTQTQNDSLTRDERPASPLSMKERKTNLEKSLAWLRQELLDMRKTDQTLIMQLMNIQMKIHSLKTEVFIDSPVVARRPIYPQHSPSEELIDFVTVDSDDELDDKTVIEEETELDVEEENGEPVAWREFQRRLSCRRTFSKRGKLPGIVKQNNKKS